MTQKTLIMRAWVARITDAALVKAMVLHFTTVQIVDLPRPQNPVKHNVFERLARKSQRNSGPSQRQGVHLTFWRGQLASKS